MTPVFLITALLSFFHFDRLTGLLRFLSFSPLSQGHSTLDVPRTSRNPTQCIVSLFANCYNCITLRKFALLPLSEKGSRPTQFTGMDASQHWTSKMTMEPKQPKRPKRPPLHPPVAELEWKHSSYCIPECLLGLMGLLACAASGEHESSSAHFGALRESAKIKACVQREVGNRCFSEGEKAFSCFFRRFSFGKPPRTRIRSRTFYVGISTPVRHPSVPPVFPKIIFGKSKVH